MGCLVPYLCGYREFEFLSNNLEAHEPTLELWSLSGTCAWPLLSPWILAVKNLLPNHLTEKML